MARVAEKWNIKDRMELTRWKMVVGAAGLDSEMVPGEIIDY